MAVTCTGGSASWREPQPTQVQASREELHSSCAGCNACILMMTAQTGPACFPNRTCAAGAPSCAAASGAATASKSSTADPAAAHIMSADELSSREGPGAW